MPELICDSCGDLLLFDEKQKSIYIIESGFGGAVPLDENKKRMVVCKTCFSRFKKIAAKKDKKYDV